MQPVRTISGTVKLPGSKSLSNRILLLAALAEGTTVVKNLLVSWLQLAAWQHQQQHQHDSTSMAAPAWQQQSSCCCSAYQHPRQQQQFPTATGRA